MFLARDDVNSGVGTASFLKALHTRASRPLPIRFGLPEGFWREAEVH